MRILLFIFTLFLSSLAHAEHHSPFLKAIRFSALHKQVTLANPLTTIEGSKVRMVVFTTYTGYKTTDTEVGATIWATAAPDVKKLCAKYVKEQQPTPKELSIWIAKLLGLAEENAENRQFVEMDVPVIQAYYGESQKNIGIFRPCTDPRISAHSDGSVSCPKQMNVEDHNISSDYKTWYINNSILSHNVENGMPWTEQGYTYNWNTVRDNEVGVAEFVIMKNTPISIIANPVNTNSVYIDATSYCNPY